jgi:hypothetical protein
MIAWESKTDKPDSMEGTGFLIPLISSLITAAVVTGIFVITQAVKFGGLANQVKNNAEQLREYPKIRERLAAVEKMVEQLGADLERARAELQRKADR